MILRPDQHLAPLYRRSPFQVALLFVATGGFYIFYWAYKVRRWCEYTLEKPNHSTWKTIALIVPIFNFFMLYDLGMLIKGAGSRARIAVPVGLAFLGIAGFFVALLYRLPEPYWLVSFFEFVPLTIMYVAFERAQLTIHGSGATPQGFTWFEYVLIVLGAVIFGLALLVMVLPAPDGTPAKNPAFVYGAFAALLVTLAVTKVQSDKLLKTFAARNDVVSAPEVA